MTTAIIEANDRKTAEINAAIERSQREIELIEEYRTTLIATAVTGKIDVRPVHCTRQGAMHHPSLPLFPIASPEKSS